MLLTIIKNANLGLAFLLELGVLASLCYWGFTCGQGLVGKLVLGIGLPVLAIVIWSLFGAPRANWQLQGLAFLLLQILFFGSAAVALFVAGQRVLGVVFALLFVLNLVLIYVLKQ